MDRAARSRWTMKVGEVRGIAVRVHLTLALLLGWIAISYATHGAGARGTATALVLVASVFLAILAHELGHALVARYFGYRTRDIMLLPIGGITTLPQMPKRPAHELAVAIVGPAINLVIAGALWCVLQATGGSTRFADSGVNGSLATQLMWVNLGLAAFNMLPAFPMDGGRALRALLAMKLGPVLATRIAGTIGKVFAVAIGGYGVYANPMLVLIALVVWRGASREGVAFAQMKSALAGVPVSDAMLRRIETVTPDQPLEAAAALLMSGRQNELPVVDHGETVGVLTRGDIASALAHATIDATVASAHHHEALTVAPSDSLDDVLERLRRSPDSIGIVVDHGNTVGLITSERLATYVALHARRAA